MLRFTEIEGPLTWAKLTAADRKRAALLWAFGGSEDAIEELLGETARFAVRDGKKLVATWWQRHDAGLLFGAGERVLGEAIQHGFVAGDRALWARLATAEGLPGKISWAVGVAGKRWKPPAAAPLVAAMVAPSKVGAKPSKPAAKPATYRAGARVRILFGGIWYDGRVLRKVGARYAITYEGWDASWDELVGADRLQAALPVVREGDFATGDAVMIEWEGAWYPGKILSVKKRGYEVSYDGFTSSWYQVVPATRLKRIAKPRRATSPR